jgi:hypothetical protein
VPPNGTNPGKISVRWVRFVGSIGQKLEGPSVHSNLLRSISILTCGTGVPDPQAVPAQLFRSKMESLGAESGGGGNRTRVTFPPSEGLTDASDRRKALVTTRTM